jgi:hypothetical protein
LLGSPLIAKNMLAWACGIAAAASQASIPRSFPFELASEGHLRLEMIRLPANRIARLINFFFSRHSHG